MINTQSNKLEQISLLLVLAVLVSAGSAYAIAPQTPVTSNDAPIGWQTSSFVITLTVVENGPATTYYKVDDDNYTIGNAVTIDSDGIYSLTYYSVNENGSEAPKSIEVQLDFTKPTTTITATKPDNSNYASGTWTNVSQVNVSFSASDNTSGVSITQYNIDDADWSTYEDTNVTVSGEGKHAVIYYSNDTAGNTEPMQTFEVWIDTTPPVTTDDALDGWQTSSIVTLTANESATIYYSLDDGENITDDTIIIDSDGTHTITYYSIDAAGNAEDPNTITVQLDTADPTTTITATKPDNSNYASGTWTNASSVSVNFSASDVTSGILTTQYKINNGSWSAYENNTVIISGDGKYTITYRSTDVAGNTESKQTFEVWIDTITPVTTDDALDGWQNSSVVVNLTADEPATTYYKVGGGNYTAGNTVTIDSDGTYNITYYSVDATGNAEDPSTINVQLDTADPTTTITATKPDNSNYASGTWTNVSQVNVSFSASDDTSGVSSTQYKIDSDSNWTTYEDSAIIISAEGKHTIAYHSTDIAGNAELEQTFDVWIDTTPPATTDDAPDGWQTSSFVVTLTTEATATTYYNLNGGENIAGNTIEIDSDGIYNITYYSVDTTGNEEDQNIVVVKLDTVVPITTATATKPDNSNYESGTWTNTSPVNVTFSASDNTSGVLITQYRINNGTLTAYENGTITISAEGKHTITYYSTDVAGNIEAEKTFDVWIDTTLPVTTDDAPTGWQTSSFVVNLTADEPATTYYSLNDNDNIAGNTIIIDSDGTYTIIYYSVDATGNQEETKFIEVKLDSADPATTATGRTISSNYESGTWTNADSVSIEFSASDETSGVARIKYKVDDNDWNIYEDSAVTVSGEGKHTITYYSEDVAGNTEVEQTFDVWIALPPITLVDAPDVWKTSSFVITLTVVENGPATTYYSLNGGENVTGNTIAIDSDGTHSITYYSVNEFVAEDPNTINVQLDTVDPTTTATATKPDNSNYESKTWTNADSVSIEFSAADETSGVAHIKYKVGDAAWSTYNGSAVNVSGEGKHTVIYRSTDVAGNTEPMQTFEVWIDTTLPSTTDNASIDWVADSATVNLSPTDERSGINTTYYLVDGDPNEDDFEEGTSVEVSGNGIHTIIYYSIDIAGNSEEQKTVQVNVDSEAPTLASLGNDGAYKFGLWGASGVTVTATCDDSSGSGCTSENAIIYCIDSGCEPNTAYSEGGITISGEGTTYVTMRATDNVGKTTTQTNEIKIDKTAPSTVITGSTDSGAYNSGTWTNASSVSANFSASDIMSGVSITQYKIDDGNLTMYENTVTISGEGKHTVTYHSTDVVDNAELEQTFDVWIDNTLPITTATATKPDNSNYESGTWTNANSVNIEFSASDDASGITHTKYKIDDADWSTYEDNVVTVSGEGKHAVTYRSTDAAGNTESEKTFNVWIDRTSAVTLIDAPAVWQNSSFVVTLTVVENGPATTYYSLDGSADTEGNTVTIDSDGTHTITYYSVDAAGNAEDPNTVNVQLDTVDPTTTATGSTDSSNYEFGTWTNSNQVTMNFSASDITSGVSSTQYKINSGEWNTYSNGAAVVSGEGIHNVTYRSTDVAGNIEAEKTFDVWIDTTLPVTTDDAPAGWATDSAIINLSPTDELSGVETTHYLVDGDPDEDDFKEGTSTEVSGNGIHTIIYYSIDIAGNSEEQKTVQVKVDSENPILTELGNDGAYEFASWSGSDVTVTATCSDSGSGCVSENAITYCIGSECEPDTAYAEGGVTISNEGTTYVTMRAMDNVGKTTTENYEVKIDKTAPTVQIDSPADDGIFKTATVDVSYGLSDDGSGLMTNTESNACSYTLDTNDAVKLDECNEAIDLGELANGQHTLTLTAVDNAGNTNQATNAFFIYVISEGSGEGLADSANFTFGNDTNKLIVPVGSPLTSVTAPSTNTSNPVNLDLSYLQDGNKSVELTNNFTLMRDAGDVNYAAELPAGTVISGGLDWDGLLTLPTVKQNSDYSAPTGSVDVVVDMGSSNELTFSKAVKVTIGGMAGKKAGWARGSGALTKIETVCDSADNPTNISADVDPKECAIDSGADLIIWTYHFTQFAAYTPATTNSNTNSGSTANSGGGGGGGGGLSRKLNNTSPAEVPKNILTQSNQTIVTQENNNNDNDNAITGAAIGVISGKGSAIWKVALLVLFVVALVVRPSRKVIFDKLIKTPLRLVLRIKPKTEQSAQEQPPKNEPPEMV